ncbi:muts domain V-domain-containing protein [Limtongia smithiae]|uniref:muts domain V-domain-containing protein n=1 Tax=Limtongia smithiae TaxID=1125753 RepID=UPI0034CFA116
MPANPDITFADRSDEAGFVSFFRGLPSSEDPNLIRVFARGDYYTCHGADALYVAQNVYRTLTVLKYLGGGHNSHDGLPSCTLSPAVFANFIRDALLTRGLKIDIYTSSGRNNWTVTKQASPGNIQAVDDILSSGSTAAPVVVAVRVASKADAKVVGVCFADASARELGVSEFVDNELFSNLESLIIQLGVKELLVPQDTSENKQNYDLKKVRGIADRCGVVITERKSSEFGARDIEQDLTRLLGGGDNDAASAATTAATLLPQTGLKTAMQAAACLVRYLGLMSDSSNFGNYTLFQHDLSQYMKLDASAVRALNLMPGPRDGAKNMSLYGLLNKTKTAGGARLLAQWLKQPLMDLAEIEQRHALVGVFVEDTQLRQAMQEEHLRAIPDMHRVAKKFQRGAAGLEDVVRVYQMLVRLPDLIDALGEAGDASDDVISEVYTDKLTEYNNGLQKLVELVETTVDLDALEQHHEFTIKPEFDESLKEAHDKIATLRDEMQDEHVRVGDELGMEPDKKLKLEQHSVYGWCLRLTRNDAACLRGKRNYHELSTQKTGVFFTTPVLRDLATAYTDMSTSYHRMQSGLIKEVVAVASTYCGMLEKLGASIAHLDVIVSFAHVSATAPTPFVRPRMHPRGTGSTVLRAARHPCMEAQDDMTFIPNDVELVRGKSEFAVITGPNMGGKSTYIRQVGVIALLAQAGCFVPCEDDAELCIFDCILARVGAGDSQLKGVSTFMAEMLETAAILKSATRESLIIIDELGRGTSTYDGFGLAWAISQHIVKEIKCFGLFATHFHELTGLSEMYPQVQNLHVVAHVDASTETTSSGGSKEITLLYKVEPGVSDQSFGIHVAELVRFPEKVIRMAKRKAAELEDVSGGAASSSSEDASRATKCSKSEIEEGSELLRSILQEWRQRTSATDEEHQVDQKWLISEFKAVIESSEYKDKLKASTFVQEVLAL